MKRAHSHYPKTGSYIPTCLCGHPEEDSPRDDDRSMLHFLGLALFIILSIGLACVAIHVGADSLTLTDPEYKAVEEAVSTREVCRKRFERASDTALNSPLKCDQAVPALSELQTSFAFKIASEARYDSVLSAHRLAHSCADCDFAPDFKSLVRKSKTP